VADLAVFDLCTNSSNFLIKILNSKSDLIQFKFDLNLNRILFFGFRFELESEFKIQI
jgi:hypothetical protein